MPALNEVLKVRIEAEEQERRARVTDKLIKRAARREFHKRINTYSGMSAEDVARISEEEWDDFVEVVR